jgi:hypothetical protein
MNREKFFSVLCSAVIAFCIAFGGVSCLISAFSLPAEAQDLAFYCVGFGLVASLLLQKKWGNWILASLILLIGVILWLMGDLRDSVKLLLFDITTDYDKAYGWGVLQWGTMPVKISVELAMGAVATLIIWTVTDGVIRRRPAIGAVTVGLLPLFACMVVTDTIPSTVSLFWLFFGILLLVLTQTVRRKAPVDGNRLTAILLIPALLAVSVLFWAIPQQGYTPPESVPDWLNQIFSQVSLGAGSGSGSGTGTGVGATNEKVNLSNVGPRTDQKYIVMEITADQGGVFYLRGQSYDIYNGTSWEITLDGKGTDPYFPTMGLQDAGMVHIRLRREKDKLYLPYYASLMSKMKDGRYENTVGDTYSLQRLEPGSEGAKLSSPVTMHTLVEQCLQLPADTKTWAETHVWNIGVRSGQTLEKKVQIIEYFVQKSARYDKKTEKMPDGWTDFARWFMEEGETGYCVHFATAATVLLRAAGIPARYVTGYLATVGKVKTSVWAEQSHAWVEYLDPERGWTVLDPTPAELEPEPTETTAPPITENPTETTTSPTETTEQSTQETVSTTASQETTLPGTIPSTGSDPEEEKDLTLLWNCLKALVYAMLAVAVILGQYALRLRLRHNKRRGSPNQQALAMWKEIVHFSKLYHKPLSEELIALAEKAKFSQHTLSPQEVRQFKNQLRNLSQALSEKPWYQWLVFKLIFAAE